MPILKSLLSMNIWNFNMRGYIVKNVVVSFRLIVIKDTHREKAT